MFEILDTLNSSKYFTGIMMILLNIGSRFVEIKLGSSMEASFVVLSEFLLNHKSRFCVLPDKYKTINVDSNSDGVISDSEINKAIETLEKAKRQKEKDRHLNLLNFYNQSLV